MSITIVFFRKNWRQLVDEKLQSSDLKEALSEASPFLVRNQDVALVSESALLPLLEEKGSEEPV